MEPKWRRNIPAPTDEILVKDGHLTIRLVRLEDSWYANIESAIEGKIFSGPVTEMSELIVSNSDISSLINPDEMGDMNG
ncbi:MAG: hypothetical protein CL777_05825 [Chloroflexi bacterium]|nr:hypothetical protein [Chloroflexota bacterium]